MIEKLYEASRAGVKVQLIVRSICSLAPGLPGQSENITVTRIVDRYLEHARIFVFHNNGDTRYYMGSADWMNRNLHSRVEVIFPIYDASLTKELATILQLQLEDNAKACTLKCTTMLGAAENVMPSPNPYGEGIAAQQQIYNYVKGLV
jgi:polyphosphate kinase